MDIVTFETAKELDGVGFPSPKFSAGQIWYNRQGFASIIVRDLGDDLFSSIDFHEGELIGWRNSKEVRAGENVLYADEVTFAPSATDIQLANPFIKSMYDGLNEYWVASENDRGFTGYSKDSAAEACAVVYLKYVEYRRNLMETITTSK